MPSNSTYQPYGSLVGMDPRQVLPHGPSKLLVDQYLWYSPKLGAISCYTPRQVDVQDHFGLFRGVDQVEAFAQGTIASSCLIQEADKQEKSLSEIKDEFNTVFLEIGRVIFHRALAEGDTFIAMGQVTFYKFRQMSMDGKIFKAPRPVDLRKYFEGFTEEDFTKCNLDPGFELATELQGIVGKAVKISKLK